MGVCQRANPTSHGHWQLLTCRARRRPAATWRQPPWLLHRGSHNSRLRQSPSPGETSRRWQRAPSGINILYSHATACYNSGLMERHEGAAAAACCKIAVRMQWVHCTACSCQNGQRNVPCPVGRGPLSRVGFSRQCADLRSLAGRIFRVSLRHSAMAGTQEPQLGWQHS